MSLLCKKVMAAAVELQLPVSTRKDWFYNCYGPKVKLKSFFLCMTVYRHSDVMEPCHLPYLSHCLSAERER